MLLLLTGALAVEPVTVVGLRQVMVVALRSVVEAVLGLVTVAVLGEATVALPGPVIVVAPGLVTVTGLGVATVALLGAVTVMGFTTAGVFSARVLASMASVIRGGGIGTIRVILIPTRTTAIPTMAARTMATRITVIRTTETMNLAHPLPKCSKPRLHNGAIIAVLLTVCGVRELAMRFDRSRPIKAYR